MAQMKNTIDNILLSGYLREHEEEYTNTKIPNLVTKIMSIYVKEYSTESFGSHEFSSNPSINLLSALNNSCSNGNIFKSNVNCNLNRTFALKLSESIQLHMEHIVSDPTEKIIDIQQSETHTLILTNSGNVYSYGSNDNGQCGLGANIAYIKQPTQIPFDCKIKSIACGKLHSLFINNDGKLLVCGFNYCGQLGLQDQDIIYNTVDYDSDSDSDSDYDSDSDSDEWFLEQCKPIWIPVYNKYFDDLNIKFMHISCGLFHSLCLTTLGECYTFGHNGFGNLGNGSCTEYGEGINIPYKLDINKRFVSGSSGENHNVLLTDCNEIVVFGDNNSNQCANSIDLNQIETPYILSKEKEFGIEKQNCFVEKVISDNDKSTLIIDIYKRVILC